MQKTTTIIFLLFSFSILHAKPPLNNSTLDSKKLKSVFENSYSIGLEINDIAIQENALVNILSLDVTDTLSVYRLLEFYFKNDSYIKAFLFSKKYLETNKNNIILLDFNAKAAEMVDKYMDAKNGYQKLYLFTSDTYYAYLYANAAYMLGNYNESLSQILEIENNDDTKKRFVSFALEDNRSQNVVVTAALYYLKGLVLGKLNKPEESKISFEKAVQIQPDFIVAKKLIH